METQVGLKTTALTLFLNLFFHFLPAAALCDDFSLVDSVDSMRQSIKKQQLLAKITPDFGKTTELH